MRNYGLDLDKEALDRDGTEWTFGASSPTCIAEIPLFERAKYLPMGELQNIGEEKFDCVSRGFLNILETKLNYLIANNKISVANYNWLIGNGYILPSKTVELSDAFIAIKSGTTRNGNSMKAPLDTIRKCGVIPKALLPQLSGFDENYDTKRITEKMEALGLEFIRRFQINYEQVYMPAFEELLKKDLLNVAGYAWTIPVNGVYPASSYPFNHDFILFSLPRWQAFDNYIDTYDGDYIKTLASDYQFMNYGYRIIIAKENQVDNSTTVSEIFETIKAVINSIAVALGLISKKIDELPQKPPVTPPVVPVIPPQVSKIELGEVAKKYLGKDISKTQNTLGCAESVSFILHEAIPSFPEGILSTEVLKKEIIKSKLFTATLDPEPNSVIISPTVGNKVGHTGVIIEDKKIISNDSATSTMKQNYTFDSWIDKFKRSKGLHIYIFKLK